MNFSEKNLLKPTGDQPQAIENLVAGLRAKRRFQTLVGVTGSGKTLTMAHVISRAQRPALVISHNKTLAAQLYQEFKEFFPENAAHYLFRITTTISPRPISPRPTPILKKTPR